MGSWQMCRRVKVVVVVVVVFVAVKPNMLAPTLSAAAALLQ